MMSPELREERGIKNTSPTHGAGLDLIFFRVQSGATGPPEYTFVAAKLANFSSIEQINSRVKR